MPETLRDIWNSFVALWPISWQPYAPYIVISISAIATAATTANPIIDFVKKIRGEQKLSVPIEQYRGNLIAKFTQATNAIEAAISELKNRPKFPMVLGEPPREDQIQFLEDYLSLIIRIQDRVFAALDKNNVVKAHEILNELKLASFRLSHEMEENTKLYEQSMTMSVEGGGFYGAQIRLRRTILKHIQPLLEQEPNEAPST